ncbi:MAG: PEP-CTERM sorting domain-containing protein [Bryobacteraceae bacterium]
MKTKIAISVLFIAAALSRPAQAGQLFMNITLPTIPAHHSSLVLGESVNLYLSGPGFPSPTNGYIIASGYDNLFPSTSIQPPKFTGATQVDLEVAQNGSGSSAHVGLGLDSNDAPYVGPSDGIVLNFSNVKQNLGGLPLAAVTFSLVQDVTGDANWVIYGTTGANGTGTATLLDSGPTSILGPITFTTNSIYASYVIGESNDCALDIENIELEYAAPEPGTFALAGMALMGLGAALKKRGRKA